MKWEQNNFLTSAHECKLNVEAEETDQRDRQRPVGIIYDRYLKFEKT